MQETHRAYQRERDVAVTLINMVGVHQQLCEWQQALAIYATARDILERIGAQSPLATLFNNLAEIFHETDHPDQTKNYLDMALEIHQAQNNLEGQAKSLNNIAVQILKNDPHRAGDYLRQALSIGEKIQDRDGQATYL